uniref:Bardet-Biedl syndrome 1 n=1 Tax=Timema bartmani TaxID=61472 RepID=A0A7R9EWU7_9NEOP|nr:unnamed protein product [Timema bartmani]
MLQNVRQEVGFSNLTPRSQQLLLLERSKWQQFVSQHRDYPLKRQTVATCMTTLKKSMSEDYAVSCLVVGTESGEIFMLDPEAFTILETMSLCGSGTDSSPLVPAQVAATGLYDVEYRVVTACRDGSVCLVRRGWKEAKVLAQLSAQVVDMIVQSDNASIVLATMDHSLHCYSKKGKKQWEVKLAAPVSTLTPLALPHVGTTLVCVALLGGAVHFYSGRQLCDVITAPDTVSAMLFGRFGQEEHSLILVTVGGALLVKILKRTAHFVPQSSGPGLVPVQHIKMIIPKKTKLFVEQTMRERENTSIMHQTFQQDLLRLRLNTARSCVKALQSCSNPISGSSDEPVKISAQVLGLGPTFQIHLTLQNMSDNNRPSKDLAIVFHCDDKLYNIEKPYIRVPMLVPGLLYNFMTQVEYVSDVDVSDQVRILVVRQNSTQPLLAAAINMPCFNKNFYKQHDLKCLVNFEALCLLQLASSCVLPFPPAGESALLLARTIEAMRRSSLAAHLCGRLEQTSSISLTPDRDSNLNIPVLNNQVYCKNDTLDHVATKASE